MPFGTPRVISIKSGVGWWCACIYTPANLLATRDPQDFDGDRIGQAVTQSVVAVSSRKLVTWEVLPASKFPNGPTDLANAVVDEQCWAAIAGKWLKIQSAVDK